MWKPRLSQGDDPWLKSTNNHIGRQYWELQLAKEKPCGKKLVVAIKVGDEEEISEEAVATTLRKALSFYSTLQVEDGHWPNDYGGPLFLLPGLVIGLYVTGAINTILSSEHQQEMCRYLYNHQNRDGGWGLHIKGHNIMFCTTLSYITLRFLGEGADGGDGAMGKARKWILDLDGITCIPSWGKMWLSVLESSFFDNNTYIDVISKDQTIKKYENGTLALMVKGHYSTQLGLGLSHSFLKYFALQCIVQLLMHEKKIVEMNDVGRMWCHSRMVYLAMSYLYGKRFVGPINAMVLSLRRELYSQPYHQIDRRQPRSQCAQEDLYYPHPLIQDILWGFFPQAG
ncbi:unnamed protein product, partial [Vitis vinifera]